MKRSIPMKTVERARDAIARNNQNFAERFAAGDAAGVSRLYTASGQLFPPGSGAVSGQGDIAGFWAAVMGMGVTGVELTTAEVDETEGNAVECGTYRLFAGEGNEIDDGKYLVAWRLDDDQWRLHRDIWNTSRSGE